MAKKEKFITVAQANKALPEQTAERFEIVKFEKRTSFGFIGIYGEINLKKLSIAKALHLIKMGADFIREKKQKKADDAE